MKKSLNKKLPPEKKRDLKQLTNIIREEVDDCVMVILYGSYARGNFVDYDQRVEFGIPTYFMSDYDILIVTEKRLGINENNLYSKISRLFFRNKEWRFHTHPQFINISISELNNQLDQGRYFYTDIKKEGVMLYDNGKYKLARRRKLRYEEIRNIAQEYYDDKFHVANRFLYYAEIDYRDKEYKMASFQLHQATENFLRTITLVFTLYGYKDHDLEPLINYARQHTLDICKVFPRDTDEEKRLFQLLQDAYVQARYNKDFVVAKEDIERLLRKVEQLRDITQDVCTTQIAKFAELIEKERDNKKE